MRAIVPSKALGVQILESAYTSSKRVSYHERYLQCNSRDNGSLHGGMLGLKPGAAGLAKVAVFSAHHTGVPGNPKSGSVLDKLRIRYDCKR